MQVIESIDWQTGAKAVSLVEKTISDNQVLHSDPFSPQVETREFPKVRTFEIIEEEKTRRVPILHTLAKHPLNKKSILDHIKAALIEDSSNVLNQSLKTRALTISEALAAIKHSIAGRNKDSLIDAIEALMTAPDDSWQVLCQEYSWLIRVEPDIPERLSLEGAIVNNLFRSLQHRIAVEGEPKSALKILEEWDKETELYEPHQLYLQSRLMLATQALRTYQVSLPAKQMVDYLREIIDITSTNKEAQEIYNRTYMVQFEEQKTDKSSYFSTLFSFCYSTPNPIYPPFLNDLIDAVDEIPPKIRALLLADFENDSVDCRLLIDGVWWAEANLENPDWTECLHVFDKAIEKTIAWGYPHLTAASARGKAIIHDEYLHDPDTAHKVLQDIVSKVGALPVIEEEQANVYFGQRNYKEALNIYERILPEWNPPSEQLNLGPLEEYRRAAICAAELNNWGKAATFFEEGSKRTQRIENTERYIGLYADAGFAQFKAGNYLDSIKLLNLALKEFEKFPQDNKDVKYFTLKKRLAYSIGWIAKQERDNYNPESEEPRVALCSNPETDEKVLNLPDSPVENIWLYLAQVECKFGSGRTVLDHALQIPDREADPALSFAFSFLQFKYIFRNKTYDDLPHRVYQMANAFESMHEQYQSGKRIRAKGVDSSSIVALANFASVENIIFILGTALLVRLRINLDMHDILAIWRASSLNLPIRENLISALDKIESMLLGDKKEVLIAMKTQEPIGQIRLVAALAVIHDIKTSSENLFYAHTLITTSVIGSEWEDLVVLDLAELLSVQWLEKIKFRAKLKTPMITVPQIEEACKSSETGKNKIGKILLTAHQAILLEEVSYDNLKQFHGWTESKQKQDAKTAKNPIAQRLIRAMEKPPHLTHEDVEALRQSIEEGKTPIKFDSPFGPDESENHE